MEKPPRIADWHPRGQTAAGSLSTNHEVARYFPAACQCRRDRIDFPRRRAENSLPSLSVPRRNTRARVKRASSFARYSTMRVVRDADDNGGYARIRSTSTPGPGPEFTSADDRARCVRARAISRTISHSRHILISRNAGGIIRGPTVPQISISQVSSVAGRSQLMRRQTFSPFCGRNGYIG